jgi:hypothetical protein
MAAHKFPPAGFLVLGGLSVAASILFLIRDASVEATSERIWSAVAFGVVGVFLLAAYWADRHSSAR